MATYQPVRRDDRRTRRRAGRVLALLAALVTMGAGAAGSASADVYCVADAACVTAGGTAQATVQEALTGAGAHAGPDVVQIGAGTFTATAPGGFLYSGDGSVEVRGAGRALTTLEAPDATAAQTVSTLSVGGTGSSVHDLHIVVPGGTACCGGSYGLFAGDVSIDRIDMTSTPSAVIQVGVSFSGSLRNSTIAVSTTAGGATAVRVLDGTAGLIEDSTLSGLYAVYATATAPTPTVVTVRRSRLIGGAFAVYDQASDVTLDDTFVTAASAASGTVGLLLGTSVTRGATATVRGSTFSGADKAIGVASVNAGRTAAATVASTILRSTGPSLTRSADGGGTANLTIVYSDYLPPPAAASFGPGTLTQGAGNTNVADARFVDAAAGDYRLRLDSPLRDLGDPAALLLGESATDLAGAPRVVDGDGDGSARRDIGAFEYQPQAPVAAAVATPAAAAIGQLVGFDASSSRDPEPADTLTFAWAFDDGATATGASVQHAFATAGAHAGTVTVRDSTGQQATAVAAVIVATPPPPPPPPPNATPPALTVLRLTPSRFRAATRGASAARRAATPVGTSVSYRLSKAAAVRFTVARRTRGRRQGAGCRAPARANRRGRPCTRYTALRGGFSRTGVAGAGRLRFSGRLGGRALKAARYRLTAVPRDAAGHTGRPAMASFTIVR